MKENGSKPTPVWTQKKILSPNDAMFEQDLNTKYELTRQGEGSFLGRRNSTCKGSKKFTSINSTMDEFW